MRIRLFHRTTAAAADAILKDGFVGKAHHKADGEIVWLSDRPLNGLGRERSAATLEAIIDATVEEMANWEYPEIGHGHREFRVPAAVAANATVRLLSDEEIDAIESGKDDDIFRMAELEWEDVPDDEPVDD